jgi:hypothetical protein
MSELLDHLADDAMPALIEKLSEAEPEWTGPIYELYSSLLLAVLSRDATMYPDIATLEAQFQTILREWDQAKSHDDQVQLAKVAKEIATEYRRRVTEYKQMLKQKISTMRNLWAAQNWRLSEAKSDLTGQGWVYPILHTGQHSLRPFI